MGPWNRCLNFGTLMLCSNVSYLYCKVNKRFCDGRLSVWPVDRNFVSCRKTHTYFSLCIWTWRTSQHSINITVNCLDSNGQFNNGSKPWRMGNFRTLSGSIWHVRHFNGQLYLEVFVWTLYQDFYRCCMESKRKTWLTIKFHSFALII